MTSGAAARLQVFWVFKVGREVAIRQAVACCQQFELSQPAAPFCGHAFVKAGRQFGLQLVADRTRGNG